MDFQILFKSKKKDDDWVLDDWMLDDWMTGCWIISVNKRLNNSYFKIR